MQTGFCSSETLLWEPVSEVIQLMPVFTDTDGEDNPPAGGMNGPTATPTHGQQSEVTPAPVKNYYISNYVCETL